MRQATYPSKTSHTLKPISSIADLATWWHRACWYRACQVVQCIQAGRHYRFCGRTEGNTWPLDFARGSRIHCCIIASQLLDLSYAQTRPKNERNSLKLTLQSHLLQTAFSIFHCSPTLAWLWVGQIFLLARNEATFGRQSDCTRSSGQELPSPPEWVLRQWALRGISGEQLLEMQS